MSKGPAKAFGMMDQSAGAATDGRVVAGGEVVVEEWVLGEKGEAQGAECGIDEIDDDDLGGGE